MPTFGNEIYVLVRYAKRLTFISRIFWFLAFVIGLILAVVLINQLWRNFHENPIIVSFAPFETTVDDIPFPAVTICNMNKVQKSDALAIIKFVFTTNTCAPFQIARNPN